MSLPPPPLPCPFGRYELLSLLGEGGMARVYKARLTGPSGFAKVVAIKLVHRDLTERDDTLLAGLITEARIGGLLKHPHIVDVYDFGEADGQLFVAMEWIDGVDASVLLTRGGPLPPRRALDVAIALADALHYLHTLEGDDGPLRLVHRDLKPSNVLIGRRGEIKLMDFGIARGEGLSGNTASGVAKGSAPWMSPEQALALPLDGRSDQFALGTVLFELVAGRRFNDQPSVTAVVGGLLGVEARIGPGGELDGLDALAWGLAEVVRRCLRRDPEDRYPDASALAARLRSLRAELPEGEPLAAYVEAHLTASDRATISLDPTEAISSDHPLYPPRRPPPSSPLRAPAAPPARRAALPAAVVVLGLAAAAALLFGGGDSEDRSGLVADEPPATTASPPLPKRRLIPITKSGHLQGEPGLSPDALRVVFVRILEGTRTLVLKDLETGAEQPLVPGDLRDLGQPTWSHDGRFLAFSARSPRPGLYTLAMDVPDAVPQRVSEEGVHPDFSPDDRFLAYSTEPIGRPVGKRGISEIRIVDLASLERRTLVSSDANQPKWSPDGQRIAYWAVDKRSWRDVWTVNVATGEAAAVTQSSDVDWNPVWAADGEHLYFLTDRDGGAGGLHRVRIDPVSGVPITPPESMGSSTDSEVGMLSIDRTGRWIASDSSVTTENMQLLALDETGRPTGPATWLTSGSRRVVWSEPSPGGGQLVWVELQTIAPALPSRDGSGIRRDRLRSEGPAVEDLWIASTQGEWTPRLLTYDSFRNRLPKWLDDHRIVFYSNRGGSWAHWIVEAGGGEPVPVDTDQSPSTTFAISPDETLATALHEGADIVLLTLGPDGRASSRTRAMVDRPANTAPRPSSWSPDGRRLILEGESSADGGRWVAAWTPETGEIEVGSSSLSMLRWVSNDTVLAAQGAKIVRVRWPDGEPEVVHELPRGTTPGWLGLSRDRRFLTVHHQREDTGIWLWELVDR